VPEPRGAVDLVVSGRIATLAGRTGFGWAEALAVSDGRVVAVGTRPDMEALAGHATEHWHLRPGLVVTPSLTDAHLHLALASLAAGQPDLTGLDLAGVAAAISAAHHRLLDQGGIYFRTDSFITEKLNRNIFLFGLIA